MPFDPRNFEPGRRVPIPRKRGRRKETLVVTLLLVAGMLLLLLPAAVEALVALIRHLL